MTEWQWQVILALIRISLQMLMIIPNAYAMTIRPDDINILEEALKREESYNANIRNS